MVHLFNSRGRILFFPVKWANAVASWILGLHSPSGTIRVSNTANPCESGGASIDVDMEVVAAKTKERLTGHFQTKREVESAIERAADGSSIVARDRRLHVSEDWLKEAIGETEATVDSSATISAVGSTASAGSATTAAPSDHVHALPIDSSIAYDSSNKTFGVNVDANGGLESGTDGLAVAVDADGGLVVGTNGLALDDVGTTSETLQLITSTTVSTTEIQLKFYGLKIDANGRVVGKATSPYKTVSVGPSF